MALYMRIAGLISIAFMIVVGLIVCGRMLLLALRTRQLPEAAMGTGLLCIMVLGAPVSAVSRMPSVYGTPLGNVLLTWGLVVSGLGIWLMYLFTWTVFRRESSWGRMLIYSIAAGLCVLTFFQLSTTLAAGSVAEAAIRARPFSLTYIVLVASLFLWTAVESFSYYVRLRKRLSIGLADPNVVNRFFLWGLGGVIVVVMCCGLAILISQGYNTMRHPLGQLQVGVAASLVASCWYLAFLPPRAYSEWIAGRSTHTAAG